MWQGAITALISPFDDAGEIDFAALDKLIERQIEQGIEGIVPCGSTGEAITMTLDERCAVIERTVKTVNKRIPVIAGTGGSATAEVVEATKRAFALGADGALINTPAYNKPQQEGLYLHYAAVANAVPGLPVMLYNIPGRTAVLMETATIERLCEDFPKVFVAYKDATANLKQTEELIRKTPLTVLSGDDGLTVPMISIGALGIVSVAGNVIPKQIRELSDHARAGRYDEAAKLNHRVTPVVEACFVESNPVPAKYGAHLLGLCKPHARLPLAPATDRTKEVVRKALTDIGVL
ncbi:MAG: 4-hydroxy-tetrahydrodipicolinate synthase [Planctomycetes bacterium]|nr:4-hydroxy-tetrahydrodipicolinate synthase [Planctomycetota bacterium]